MLKYTIENRFIEEVAEIVEGGLSSISEELVSGNNLELKGALNYIKDALVESLDFSGELDFNPNSYPGSEYMINYGSIVNYLSPMLYLNFQIDVEEDEIEEVEAMYNFSEVFIGKNSNIFIGLTLYEVEDDAYSDIIKQELLFRFNG